MELLIDLVFEIDENYRPLVLLLSEPDFLLYDAFFNFQVFFSFLPILMLTSKLHWIKFSLIERAID